MWSFLKRCFPHPNPTKENFVRNLLVIVGEIHTYWFYKKLEIKPPSELGSRIRDMEAEWRLRVITDLISW